MEYKVTKAISFSEQTYGKFANHRITFNVEGNTNVISAFGKENFIVGQTLEGEIKTVEKDGKTYYNFEKTKKEAVSSDDIIQIKNDIFKILLILKNIDANTTAKSKVPYPVNDLGPDQFPTPDENTEEPPY